MRKQENVKEREALVISRAQDICNAYDPSIAFSQLSSSDGVEIAFVTDGGGVHQVLNQAIPCKSGDIFVVPSHIPHAFFRGEEYRMLSLKTVTFDSERLLAPGFSEPGGERFCYGIFRDYSVFAYAMLNTSTRASVATYFDEIEKELCEKNNEWIEAVSANVSLLLITIGRYVNSAIRNLPSLPAKEWHTVSRMVRTVTEQFNDSTLTLERISGELYISKSQLSRLFHKVAGESFSEYLRSVRMAHACSLLRDTDKTVETVAEECGLRDVPSFYRNFQIATGLTPNQYRQSGVIPSQDIEKRSTERLIAEKVQKGDVGGLKKIIEASLAAGAEPQSLLDSMLRGMSAIGDRFKNNEVYVPEVLIAARAMNSGIQMLKSVITDKGLKHLGRVCIGTVQGDLHDIGKNLVKMMLEGKGFEVIDLGTDVASDEFINCAVQNKCRLICCSALLTTTMNAIGEVVEKAKQAGIRDKIKILVGGAPLSEEFCRQMGADAYTDDAASAADEAVRLFELIEKEGKCL